MSIIGSDPLAFLTYQGGVVATPLSENAAQGDTSLDSQQRAAIIGEPIPIVFCRRVGNVGGVLISPPATEAQFANTIGNDIIAGYHLILSEGQIDSIQVRDVFQRACRLGSYTQTYSRRAGNFTAGNTINNGVEAPYYCGTGGTYAGLSTMFYSVTIPAGFDQWNRQVHCFIRGGIYVLRLIDGVTGPSNNVADLLLYLIRSTSRVPEQQIDIDSYLAAGVFTNANGFWFNGVIKESTNLRDWIGSTLQYFLLRQARIGGKEALRPLLPTNANGSIKLTAVMPVFTFTETHIVPDSFEITYTSLSDRKPFCASVLWRQQDDLGIPVMRTAEVRYAGTALNGPYEQHDLSSFCSSENHAIKVGAYIISKRKHVTHRLRVGVRPDSFNNTLATGDLVRVQLKRMPSTGAGSLHDHVYEVDRIGKSVTGEVTLELTHFPIDEEFVSIVAKEVNSAVGSGIVIATGLTGVTCDENSSGDTSVPGDTSTGNGGTTGLDANGDPINIDWEPGGNGEGIGGAEIELDGEDRGSWDLDGGGLSGGGLDGGGLEELNPEDNLAGQEDLPPAPQIEGTGAAGQPLTAPQDCEGQTVQWQRNGTNISGATTSEFTPEPDDVGKEITATVTCPDGSTRTTAPVVPFAPELDFSQWGQVSGTINVVYKLVEVRKNRKGLVGQSPVCDELSEIVYNSGSTLIENFASVSGKTRVRAVTLGANGEALSPAISYNYNDCPNVAAGKQLRRNGGIATTNASGLETVGTSGWGSNYTMVTYQGITSSHSTIITGFILTNDVPGLGVVGDNVVVQGIDGFINIGRPKDVGVTIDDPNSPALG